MPETVSTTPAEQTCWLPRHPRSPRAARQELRSFLLPLLAGESLLHVGELLVSELVTNAVRHARTPRGRLIFVRFQLLPDHILRIEVHDAGNGKPTLRDATTCSETGRGLLLLHQLAQSWGCSPRAGGVGKFVWCHVSPEAGAA
ncbi:ATP-binding protein [Kitasatospora sp. NPDC048194]|uniref:ATP-binding protein n=1 Tax=Kitasatospora sp. NPDC048194 TaxID=3364045 RepID=UPI00371963D6